MPTAAQSTIMSDGPMQAEHPAILESQIMDSRIPKNAAGWWAKREIERLRELVANERIECAKLAEEYNGDGIEIADLIRKRPVVTY
jgi:hypothetical protein